MKRGFLLVLLSVCLALNSVTIVYAQGGTEKTLSSSTTSLSADHNETSGNISNGGHIAQQDEWVYYCLDSTGLTKSKADGQEKHILFTEYVSNINVYENWIYFCINKDNISSEDKDNDKIGVYKITTDGSNLTKLSSDNTEWLNIKNGLMYFINKSDGNKPYSMGIDGSNKKKVSDKYISSLVLENDWLYCVESLGVERYLIFKMKTDGSQIHEVFTGSLFPGVLNVHKGWIYYVTIGGNNRQLNKTNIDGTETKKLDEENIFSLNVANDWIYYSVYLKGLFRIRLDGSEKQKLSADGDSFNVINLNNNWIYYPKYNHELNKVEIIKLKADGSELRNLEEEGKPIPKY